MARLIHIVKIALLLWPLSFCFLGSNCALFSKKKSPSDSDEWIEHPVLVRALSRAILHGMRHLTEVILISETWFEDMEISIVAEDLEILNARITHFALQKHPSKDAYCRWRIFRTAHENLRYTNTIYFDRGEKVDLAPESAGPVDSLFVDVFQTSAKLKLTNKEPSTIKVIYWRDAAQGDEVATVRMHNNSGDGFDVIYPDYWGNELN